MEFDGQVWFWTKVCVLVFYLLVLLLKVTRCRSRFQAPGLTSVAPEPAVVRSSDSQRSNIFEELDKHDSNVAYESFTCLVAPFCMLTVALSLLQDFENVPTSLTAGGSNAFPLFISTLLLLNDYRPQFKNRLRIWLALALWFLFAQLSYLLTRDLRLEENMWLNHMVFVTIISTTLQLPKLLTWSSAVLHSAGFLTLTLVIGEESGPSLGLQIFMFTVLLMSAHYASILHNVSLKRLQADLDCKTLLVKAQKCEVEAAVAQAAAHEEVLRARAAEAEFKARVDALSAAHEAVVNLLRSICDAVVQLDDDMKILAANNLSMLLYQNSQDLAGTSFLDLVAPFEQCEDGIRSAKEGPFLTTLRGSYDCRIRVAIYVSVLPQADGQVKYFLGLTEDEERLSQVSPSSSRDGRQRNKASAGLIPEASFMQRLEVLQEGLERTTSEETEQDQLLELAEEEQLQAMMAFLWSWPLPREARDARDTCCETHYVLQRAREVIRQLEKIACSDSSRLGFTWQCPACKLLGFQCDKDLFDGENNTCGRCVNWEKLC